MFLTIYFICSHLYVPLFGTDPSKLHLTRAYNREIGEKTVFYQNYAQLDKVPDNVIYPINIGSSSSNEVISLSLDNGLKAKFSGLDGNRIFSIGGMYPAAQTVIEFTASFTSSSHNRGSWYIFSHKGTLFSSFSGFNLFVERSNNGEIKYQISDNELDIFKKQFYDNSPHVFRIEWDGINHLISVSVDGQYLFSQLPMYNENTSLVKPDCFFYGHLKFSPYVCEGGETTITIHSIKQTIISNLISPMVKNVVGLSFDERAVTEGEDTSYFKLKMNALPLMKTYQFNATFMEYMSETGKSSDMWMNSSDVSSDFLLSYHLNNISQNGKMQIDGAKDNFRQFIKYDLPKVISCMRNEYTEELLSYLYVSYNEVFRDYGMPSWGADYVLNDNTTDQYVNFIRTKPPTLIVYSHDVKNVADRYEISPNNFEKIMTALFTNDYLVVDMDTYYKLLKSQNEEIAINILEKEENLRFTVQAEKSIFLSIYCPFKDVDVLDVTKGEQVNAVFYSNGSVEFWANNGHTYEIQWTSDDDTIRSSENKAETSWLFYGILFVYTCIIVIKRKKQKVRKIQ